MIRLLLVLLVLGPLGCNYATCADADASFVLPAPGDVVELTVHACGPERNGMELIVSLGADRAPEETLAIEVDGLGVHLDARDDGWISEDIGSSASSADCEPGRRITIRRLDSDDTVRISGTVAVAMSAPGRETCTADIVVIPPA
ncbi:MAG TPA: hypothetical protein VGB85_16580 [Nannocystis sp.]|jgi:hypothetical protein